MFFHQSTKARKVRKALRKSKHTVQKFSNGEVATSTAKSTGKSKLRIMAGGGKHHEEPTDQDNNNNLDLEEDIDIDIDNDIEDKQEDNTYAIDNDDFYGENIDFNDIADFEYDKEDSEFIDTNNDNDNDKPISPSISSFENYGVGLLDDVKRSLNEELVRMGIVKSMHGVEKRTMSHVKTLIGRVCDFFNWSHKHTHNGHPLEVTMLTLWIKTFLLTGYAVLFDYVDYLSNAKSFQASTILSYLDDVKATAVWFVLYSGLSECKHADLTGVNHTIRALRIIQHKVVTHINFPCILFCSLIVVCTCHSAGKARV